jgi:hypothetical protein
MKKLWLKIKSKVSILFSKFKKTLENNIEPAIKVVNIIKEAVENPALNILVTITPFGWDDEALKLAKSVLPKALLELQILNVAVGKSNTELVKTIVEEIRQYTPNARTQFYEDLAVMVSIMLSDGKLSVDEAAQLVKFVYENKYKNK